MNLMSNGFSEYWIFVNFLVGKEGNPLMLINYLHLKRAFRRLYHHQVKVRIEKSLLKYK